MADVVFILDSSASIRQEDWRVLLNFVSEVVGRLEVSREDIHVGAARYASDVSIEVRLDYSFEARRIQDRIRDIRKVEGNTNMREAFRRVSAEMFNRNMPGDRAEAPDIIVIISDGRTDNRDGTLIEANNVRSRGITIIPVGIDIDGDMGLLRSIASDPSDVDRLRVTSYNQLANRINSLVNILCPEAPPAGMWLCC